MEHHVHPWGGRSQSRSWIDTLEERLLNVVQGPWQRYGTTVRSPLLGDLRVGRDDVLEFLEPIVGFPRCRRYALLPYQQAGRDDPDMHWLQALEEPFHTFLITDVWSADPDYEPDIDHADVASLGVSSFDSTALYAIVTVSRRTGQITANLRAPLVVSTARSVARQVVLRNREEYDTRFRICDLP